MTTRIIDVDSTPTPSAPEGAKAGVGLYYIESTPEGSWYIVLYHAKEEGVNTTMLRVDGDVVTALQPSADHDAILRRGCEATLFAI